MIQILARIIYRTSTLLLLLKIVNPNIDNYSYGWIFLICVLSEYNNMFKKGETK